MSEWRFKRDTAFRKQFFVPDSWAHPAKMDAQLLLKIVETYTGPGETILDPMAGMGTTMLACTLGRDVVLVELEEKFCKMCRDNWEIVKRKPQLGYEMGTCQILQGDARQLEGLLVDKIVTSPPYTNRMDGGVRGPRAGMVPYTDESPDAWFTQRDQQNIGNLPYGNIDSIITSPPYGNPREATQEQDDKRDLQLSPKLQWVRRAFRGRYSPVDSIITSPPYADQNPSQLKSGIIGKMREELHGEERKELVKANGYSKNPSNIGNLKSTSYLEAMARVYSQCHSVLKPQGLMILVTKNFIREKQIVRLDEDTIKLCEQAGFSFLERHYRRLPSQSFWRIIYKQKYPDVETIDYEDILVFQK